MTDKKGILIKLKEKNTTSTHQSISKVYSERLRRKKENEWDTKVTSQVIPQAIAYVLMKERVEKFYKNIRSTLDDEHLLVKIDSIDTQLTSSKHTIAQFEVRNQSTNSSYLNIPFQIKRSSPFPLDHSLQINTASEPDRRVGAKGAMQQPQPMRKSLHRKKILEPINLSKPKMSNSIKDYLSVQKISIKEIEGSLLSNKMKLLKQYEQSNLLSFSNRQKQGKQGLPTYQLKIMMGDSPIKQRSNNALANKLSKFKPPFSLYYYRDFIWKVAFSNEYLVQIVEEYESKVKYFVGKGNNSNLIKGVMKRRPWFQLTEKVQEAHLVWTQIKIPSIFPTQKKGDLKALFDQSKQSLENNKDANKLSKERYFKLFNVCENQQWSDYWTKHMNKQKSMKQALKGRTKIFGIIDHSLTEAKNTIKIHNHFCNNFLIGNKKALFQTMSEYYSKTGGQVFDFLPLTFHIKNGLEDDEYLKFLQHFYSISKDNKSNQQSINKFNAWIIKPGQNTNRGNGIIVCLELNEIKSILKRKEKHEDGTYKTYILQKYIERPLLYKKRKFDLRHYMMLDCSNGIMKGYWYRHGYVRTTSSEYTLEISSGSVHLTNDAVQKCLPDYGKYEKGNKITYEQLDGFIKKSDPDFDFFKSVYPKMKKIATDTIYASALNIDPLKRVNNFQVFGLDFMIDANYNVWLIEVNTNPCLETTCAVLNNIIPKFIEDTFQICVDPLFPAPLNFQSKFQDYYKNMAEENSFELVFDERIDKVCALGEEILLSQPEEDEDVFDDDGQNFQG